MTPDQHIKAAEQLLAEGDGVMNDDRVLLDTPERAQVRTAAYLGALAHVLFGAAVEE